MAQWVQWDDEAGRMLGIVRHLPQSLEGRDTSQLALLGYRELVVREPEDSIKRFPALLGEATFELLEDGRVLQTFPNADFSVAAVKNELKAMMKRQASQELGMTDWYVVRKVDTGQEVPRDIALVRNMVREHVAWIEADIDAVTNPRALVDYKWMFPKEPGQQMVNGIPVFIHPTEPPAVPELPTPADPAMPVTGENVGVFGNDDPDALDPAPSPPPPIFPDHPVTTDGPVPVLGPDERPEFIDANGMPLITVYAPNVEDTGPQPDQN